MQNVWNSNRLILFSALLLILLHPALCDAATINITQITNCNWTGVVTCDSETVTKIDLRDQNLTGSLPNISYLASLEAVNFNGNKFSDFPGGYLSGLTSLKTFSIDRNPNLVSWDVFRELTGSPLLTNFSANSANLTGPIPDIFRSFTSLHNLHLAYNKIQGPLPASLNDSGIQSLWLNNQEPGMSGTIDVIAAMPAAQELWLHANQLSGPIPDFHREFTKPFVLYLRDNLLTGIVPDSLNSPSVTLNVSNNNLQGPMPTLVSKSDIDNNTKMFCTGNTGDPCDSRVTILLQIASLFGYPLRVVKSWTGNDPCIGWDGITCDSGEVIWINLANHNLSGTIDSPVFGNLTSLTKLILNNNSITGHIPASLTTLRHLQLVDVSYNNMSGKVPQHFNSNTSVTVNTAGNPWIGIDLPPPGSGKTPSSASASGSGSNDEGTKKGLSPWAIAVVVLFVIIITAVVGYHVYKRCSKKKMFESGAYKRHQMSDSEVYTSGILGGSRQLSSQVSINISDGGIQMDLLIEVTDNFSEANVIGRGGFGTVYRAKLPDGTEVAVKRMVAPVLMSSKGMNEYKAEIEVLSKVKHRNLVGFIGFCANGNERLLVYEFMPQGTLGDHLFDWRQRGGRPLTWSQRAAIALDVARGVDYLHTMTEQSFIHRDLKPNNILLGNDMRAKVADFGLVKNATNVGESIQTKVAGTFGYFAPEYWETGRVTTKADVYAFGVILMEMISGRKVVDDSPDAIDGGNLMLRFRRILAGKEDVRDHIDPSLQADDDEETYKSICKVVELAGHCTVSEPQRRCDMRYAVFVLTSLVEQWTPSNSDVSTSFGIGHNMQLPSLVEEWKAGNGMPSTSYTYT